MQTGELPTLKGMGPGVAPRVSMDGFLTEQHARCQARALW